MISAICKCNRCGYSALPDEFGYTVEGDRIIGSCGGEGCPRLLWEDSMIVQCSQCGKDLDRWPWEVAANKTERFLCSNECRSKIGNRYTKVACVVCGAEFAKATADLKRYPNHCCSKVCRAKNNDKRKEVPCLQCGKMVLRPPSLREDRDVFCSESCHNSWQFKQIDCKCLQCGAEFTKSPCKDCLHEKAVVFDSGLMKCAKCNTELPLDSVARSGERLRKKRLKMSFGSTDVLMDFYQKGICQQCMKDVGGSKPFKFCPRCGFEQKAYEKRPGEFCASEMVKPRTPRQRTLRRNLGALGCALLLFALFVLSIWAVALCVMYNGN